MTDAPPAQRPRWRWLRRLIVAAAVLAIAYFTSGWWLRAAGHWLDVGEPPRPADVCLVLSGDFESRPFAAAALYRKGYIRHSIWLTHVSGDIGVFPQELDSDAAARRILEAARVPQERIEVINGLCASTFDEAETLKQRLTREPSPTTVMIVTSDYHTRRSRWIFRQVLGDAADRLQFVSAPTDYFNADNWWKVEEGFAAYPKEFFKLPFYYIRYGWGWLWLTALAAAVFIFRRARRRRRQLQDPAAHPA